MKVILFALAFSIFLYSDIFAMAKTYIWKCQVVDINGKPQKNGKRNSYKIDVTTPKIWVRDDTRWSGLVNTDFSYDTNNNILYSYNNIWNGSFNLADYIVIFRNTGARLVIKSQCEVQSDF